MVVKQNNSKFVRVRCNKCKNEQIIFKKAAKNVDCLVCDTTLAKSSSGNADIQARVLEVLD